MLGRGCARSSERTPKSATSVSSGPTRRPRTISTSWLGIEAAILHCASGIGIWEWASNDGGEPDVVLACAGDTPTVETFAAAAILRGYKEEGTTTTPFDMLVLNDMEYALPQSWRERWRLERTGFHGLSHAWAGSRSSELVGRSGETPRIVSCHLGAGASLCAILDGHSVDTTYTPLDGLVMATRSGSIDPGLILWLVLEGGVEPQEILDGSNAAGASRL